MTRRQTYGQRMSEWELQQDKRNWERAFLKAVADDNEQRIEDLVIEGLTEEYDFPLTTDSKVIDLIQKHSL